MYIRRITKRAEAITRQQFHEALRQWLASSTALTIGEPGKSKGWPWVIVTADDRCFHLDLDTTRQAGWSHLHPLGKDGENLAWIVRRAIRGVWVQVAFGPHQLTENEFYLAAYQGHGSTEKRKGSRRCTRA